MRRGGHSPGSIVAPISWRFCNRGVPEHRIYLFFLVFIGCFAPIFFLHRGSQLSAEMGLLGFASQSLGPYSDSHTILYPAFTNFRL